MSMIILDKASKSYNIGKVTVHALKEISLSIEKGEFICLAGPSGSGKSTVLNLLGLLDTPTSGRLIFDKKDIAEYKKHQRIRVRRDRIGFIFQNFNLLPVLTVYENIEYPLFLLKLSSSERQRRVNNALERIGLSNRKDHFPSELSGGQQQRVAIARALVTNPHIILADEPTANLDSKTGEDIINLMTRLNEENNVTFIFASHDNNIIKNAKRIIYLHDGEIKTDTKYSCVS